MNFHDLLQKMVKAGASDMFVTAKLPVSAKINGELQPIDDQVLSPDAALGLVHNSMNEKQKLQFDTEKECNFAISIDGIGRFRISAFWQRDMAGMVIRRIVTEIPDVDDLGLPSVLKEVVMSKRGLVLFVGGTGTGKSTSMAALIGYRNRNSRGHILTIEDPVEFVHEHAKCMITQREVGLDTESFDAALKSSLRQAPDVILIGEIRSQEIMEHALSFAETGHLCIATLHANNANQAIDRIMHLVPAEQHGKLLFDLALNLRGIIAQQLIPTKDGHFFAPCAFEILDIKSLGREVFGPILHVVRFKRSDLDELIDDINSTGYGLTFGVHSRIEAFQNEVAARVKAGNIYVNRSMTGAVVGVQPFGGNGLSGTGPKAGGPHYLPRFALEKTISIDTTAAGGNASLISMTD